MGLPTVFVVGCERSGTTWARSLFEAHPQAFAPPQESHVWLRADDARLAVEGGGSWQTVLDRYDHEATAPAGLHHWIARPDLARLAEQAAARQQSSLDTADWLAGSILEQRWAGVNSADTRVAVEKTPSHVFFAERILRRLPDARFLEVLRDGRDVCVSMQHRARTKAWVPQTRRAQIERWVAAVTAGRQAARLPQMEGRWHVLRYERMKAEPGKEVASALRFAGLDHDVDLVEGIVSATRFDRYEQTGPDQHRRRGEPGEWRSTFGQDDHRLFAELAGATAAAVGYGLSGDGPD